MNALDNIDTEYKVLSEIEKNSDISQRELAVKLQLSLGKINFIVKALADKGIIKLERFIGSSNKSGYRYILTPNGIKEKYKITLDFIQRKETEYERIAGEIKTAKESVRI